MTTGDVHRFARVVETRLGLRISDRRTGLDEILGRRAASHRETTAAYLSRLDDAGPEELRALAAALSVGETYFFRHAEQFHAFADLIPELTATRRPVRVLSVGCSTGEEPYTLAMLARERADPLAVDIHAIDVNPPALARARRGRYSRWAMRATPAAYEQRYFVPDGRELVLARTIVDAVAFSEANLIEPGAIPALPWDVVFCRNVLMYFADGAVRELVSRLVRALATGGYLFLGHAETLREPPDELELCHSHGTFYYRRRSPSAVTSSWPGEIAAAAERVRIMVDGALAKPASASSSYFEPIRAMMREERFADARVALARLPPSVGETADARLLAAVVLAQSDHQGGAGAICRELLETGDHATSAHYLLSICTDDTSAAEQHAEAALAADPSFAMACVQLAFLARRRGDRDAATQRFEQAVALLEREEPSRLELFSGGFGRAALIAMCREEARRSR